MENNDIRRNKIAEGIRIMEEMRTNLPEVSEIDLCSMTGLLAKDAIGIGTRFTVAMAQYEGKPSIDRYVLSEEEKEIPGYMTILPNCPLAKAVMGKCEGFITSYDVAGIKTVIKILEVEEPQKVNVKGKTIR